MGLLSVSRPTSVKVERFPASGPIAVISRFSIAGQKLTFVLVHMHVHTSFAGSIHERELDALAAA